LNDFSLKKSAVDQLYLYMRDITQKQIFINNKQNIFAFFI